MKQLQINSRIYNVVLCLMAFILLFPRITAKAALLSENLGSSARILYVKSGSAGNCLNWNTACDLQTALTTAVSGDEIWVAAGTYKPTTNTDRTIAFETGSNGIAIYGGFDGTETERDQRNYVENVTVLSGDLNGDDLGFENNSENSYNVVVNGNELLLDGFTITGGNANGDPNFYTSHGGGLFNFSYDNLVLKNIIFRNNSALSGGGLENLGHLIAINVTFQNNTAGFAGGLSNLNDAVLENVTFDSNSSSEGDCGGMYNQSANLKLMDATFSNNFGSGMCIETSGANNYSDNSEIYLENVVFSDNTAVSGGGMLIQSGVVTMTDISFDGNTAEQVGGGLYNSGDLTLTNVSFSDNMAYFDGGGIYNVDNLTMTHAAFNHNDVGVYSIRGKLTLTDVTFSHHTNCGMVNNGSNLALTNVAFNDNEHGGLIVYSGSLILENATFSNNEDGMSTGGSSTLTNVTFSDNTGVGMSVSDNTTLTNVTFSHNGIGMMSWGNPIIRNAIFWGNTIEQIRNEEGSAIVSDSIIQGGYVDGINIITADPMLGVLGNYGGFTQTIPLLSGSSAIDAGDDAHCPATDQRGVIRPQGVSCDIGAYELIQPTISGNAGIAGVIISYADGVDKTAIADNNGDYSFTVSNSWSGTVTPSKVGYTFSPASRDYSNIADNKFDENYTAVPNTYTINGNAQMAGVTINHTGGSTLTDELGNYSFTVPYGWGGTVIPTKTGYIFSPSGRDYSNISANYANEDYAVLLIPPTFNGAGIPQLVINALPTTYSYVGQVINYTYTLSNIGTTAMTGPFTIYDPQSKVSITCPVSPPSLAPGISFVCTGVYQITQADLDAGYLTAQGMSSPVYSTASNTITAVQDASISLTNISSVPVSMTDVTYTYTLTNTGNVTINSYQITDDKLGSICAATTNVAPGNSVTCTMTHAITPAEVTAGTLVNHAVATAVYKQYVVGSPVDTTITSNTATASVITTPVALFITGTLSTAGSIPPVYSAETQTIIYSFKVVNNLTTAVTLSNITIVSFTGKGTAPTVTCSGNIAGLSSMTCIATYTVVLADVNNVDVNGVNVPIQLVATANAGAYSSTASANPVDPERHPALTVSASTNPSTATTAGINVTYTYTITNTGNTTLQPKSGLFTVTDTAFNSPATIISQISCASPITPIAPAGTKTCSGIRQTTSADLTNGVILGQVDASAVFGNTILAAPAAHSLVLCSSTARLNLNIGTASSTVTGSGVPINYTYVLTNTGNAALTSLAFSPGYKGTAPVCLKTNLALGEATTCTGTYTTLPADLGKNIINTATVTAKNASTGTIVTSNTATNAVLALAPTADLAIVKNDRIESVNVGEVVTYTIRVTNNGPSSVTGATLTDTAVTGLVKTSTSCSGTPGQCVTPPTSAELETGSFSLPELASGQFYEINVVAHITSTGGNVSNTAMIAMPQGDTVDLVLGNNTATDTDIVFAKLTVTKAGLGSGTVTSSPAGITCGTTCSKSFNYGTAVTLTATPAAGSVFAGWSGACVGIGACKVTMSADKSVNATFKKEYALNGKFETYPVLTPKIPTSWIAGNFTLADGKDTLNKKDGLASVKIIGATSKVKTLMQTLSLTTLAGKPFTFSFWVKGASIPSTAGACMGQVLFYNGNMLLTSQTKTLNCALGTSTAFQKKTVTFGVIGVYTKVVIKFTYSKAIGTVWFDGVSLLQ